MSSSFKNRDAPHRQTGFSLIAVLLLLVVLTALQ
ncbi:Tfp pilus assembly protein PilX [Variovorax sp. Sphag1AA]|nr:Tfp pilus assembly protein PilX [Variovorax sp. Sphag1AA]